MCAHSGGGRCRHLNLRAFTRVHFARPRCSSRTFCTRGDCEKTIPRKGLCISPDASCAGAMQVEQPDVAFKQGSGAGNMAAPRCHRRGDRDVEVIVFVKPGEYSSCTGLRHCFRLQSEQAHLRCTAARPPAAACPTEGRWNGKDAGSPAMFFSSLPHNPRRVPGGSIVGTLPTFAVLTVSVWAVFIERLQPSTGISGVLEEKRAGFGRLSSSSTLRCWPARGVDSLFCRWIWQEIPAVSVSWVDSLPLRCCGSWEEGPTSLWK
jgi:hypothetical protein